MSLWLTLVTSAGYDFTAQRSWSTVMVTLTVSRPNIKPVIIGLSIVGFIFSAVALYQHVVFTHGLATGPSFCNISQHINCEAVNASSWSTFLGLPIASYGLFFYTALVGLMLCSGAGRSVSTHKAYEVSLALSLVASIVSLALFGISELLIGALCLMCVGLYITNFLLLGICWWATAQGSFWSGVVGGIQNIVEFVVQVVLGAPRAIVGLLAIIVCFSISVASPRIVLELVGGKPPETPNSADQEVQNWVAEWRKSPDLSPRIVREEGSFSDFGKGTINAPIQIVEFADIECPGCRVVYSRLRELLREYEGLYYLVFKNYPLDKDCNSQITWDFHAFACFAAYITRCAAEQDRFWDALDHVFSDPAIEGKEDATQVKEALLRNAAMQLNVDEQGLRECVGSGRYKIKMESDVQEGVRLGLSSTPTFFVNGKAVPFPSADTLRAIFDEVLRERGLAKKGGANIERAGE